jgi:hypothetical protein
MKNAPGTDFGGFISPVLRLFVDVENVERENVEIQIVHLYVDIRM